MGGGIRTLGHWNHNPALYQLSYTHREGNIFSLANSLPRKSNWRGKVCAARVLLEYKSFSHGFG